MFSPSQNLRFSHIAAVRFAVCTVAVSKTKLFQFKLSRRLRSFACKVIDSRACVGRVGLSKESSLWLLRGALWEPACNGHVGERVRGAEGREREGWKQKARNCLRTN